MELQVLDPFGDYETVGYLRNFHAEKDLRLVGHLETAAYEQEAVPAIRFLRRQTVLTYQHVLETHRKLFNSVYPWAGKDRLATASNIAIGKGGYNNLFAHPKDVFRAANHALHDGQNHPYLAAHPGEVFGYLAHAHPFLEGNGRTILTLFADLTRRAGFHIAWENIEKNLFLDMLTQELLSPGKGIMDRLVLPHVRQGILSVTNTAFRLKGNFHRD